MRWRLCLLARAADTAGHLPQMLPHFVRLAEKHPGPLFVIANVDNCFDTAKDVKYTPTFAFYRDGRMLDDFYGVERQRLEDRVWLHLDDGPAA